ncbi:MAG: restriction endonuclease subunit S [Pseudomonadota bacterium]
MVATALEQAPKTWDAPIKQQRFNWVSCPVQSVYKSGLRLDASVFAIEAQNSKLLITQCKYGAIPLAELIDECTYPDRFKRAYVSKRHGEKFYLPSQLNDLAPSANKFLAIKNIKDLDALRIKENTLLVTRSGTIGNCTIASKTLVGGIFSDDVIRITPKQTHNLGYIYIYLKSRSGRTILQSENYGAVIQHVEPAHLIKLPIPNAPAILKTHIHHTVTESFNLRDQSNALIEQARAILQNALKLPAVDELIPPADSNNNGLRCFSVNVAVLNHRLEANYHNPLARAITQHLYKHAAQVLTLGDNTLTGQFVLPGRFKRVYVDKGHGVIFFSGKDIGELDPNDKKYLSFSQHDKKIKDELTIKQNMLLITCSGTLGNVALVPKHWDGWTMTHDIVRLIPSSNEISGYLFAWLSSSWGKELINRNRYGAVVQYLEIEHLATIPIPLLSDVAIMREINDLVLRANELRFAAFTKEQEALRLFDEEVLGIPTSQKKRDTALTQTV